MNVVSSFKVLSGQDAGSGEFIAKYSGIVQEKAPDNPDTGATDITALVLSGRKMLIKDAVSRALKENSAMDVINNLLIPAINAAGDKFEKGEFFLPQLMSSAETVKLGFDVVKDSVPASDVVSKGKILLATVKGDIHDIGKNIVKMLLSNYGYEIIDLGKDVPPEMIVEETQKQNIKLVGLSALMTTTVRSMADTIAALKAAGVDCKVMVGGAVLNEEYAKLVGADFYSKDAAESARIAKQVLG
jgi:5-methyltetrahydrofolate--homocysteine methyltransferase